MRSGVNSRPLNSVLCVMLNSISNADLDVSENFSGVILVFRHQLASLLIERVR
jgi:hypothetical protein